MSQAVRRAMQVTKAANPVTRSVLAMLVAHMNDDGLSWPSLRLLQKETRWSRPTIIKALDELADDLTEITKFVRGHVPDEVRRATKRTPLGGWQAVNCYHIRLLYPALPQLVPLVDRRAKVVNHVDHLSGSEVVKQVVNVTEKTGPDTSITEVPVREGAAARTGREFEPFRKRLVDHAYVSLMSGDGDVPATITDLCKQYQLNWTLALIEGVIRDATALRDQALSSRRYDQAKRKHRRHA